MTKEILKEIQKYLIDNGNDKIYPDNLMAFADFVEKDRAKQYFYLVLGVVLYTNLSKKKLY